MMPFLPQFRAAGRGAFGGAPFAPTDIAGLKLWLDASDSSTLFQDSGFTTPAAADGDVVGGWKDKSGNANHATQATTANKPLLKLAIQNGKPVVRFDGTDDVLLANGVAASLSGSDKPASFFAVVKRSATAAYNVTIGGNKVGNGVPLYEMLSLSTGGALNYLNKRDDASTLKTASGGTVDLLWHILGLTCSGTLATILADGVALATNVDVDVGITTIDQVSIGSRESAPGGYLNGDIAELLVYDSALSTADRQRIESYLNAKWTVY